MEGGENLGIPGRHMYSSFEAFAAVGIEERVEITNAEISLLIAKARSPSAEGWHGKISVNEMNSMGVQIIPRGWSVDCFE